MKLAERGCKLEEFEETRRRAQAELEALTAREERAKDLKRNWDALLESWVGVVPDALDGLAPEDRNGIYRMLRLEVMPGRRATGFRTLAPRDRRGSGRSPDNRACVPCRRGGRGR